MIARHGGRVVVVASSNGSGRVLVADVQDAAAPEGGAFEPLVYLASSDTHTLRGAAVDTDAV